MSSIIKVEGLGKSYTLHHEERERYTALRDVITRKTKKLFVRNKSTTKQIHQSTNQEFWALKEINFEVQQGDRIGIIGRNGAGKSTLLKILSRITEPTTGSVKIKGRVASLLEVGTGFHPELTGAENIYLNGAILGMSRAEVKKKFDEIVNFAEVEKFLDTPVKRYSSGMYVRLAFAVAAHLEPEILVVDEVLAVGDAQFQKKCLGKMEDVSVNEGRTVLFVSHNMQTVMSLCNIGILLEQGLVKNVGTIDQTVKMYLNLGYGQISEKIWIKNRPGNEYVKLNSIFAKTSERLKKENFNIDEDVLIEINYDVLVAGQILWLGLNVYNSEGINVFDTHSITSEYYNKPHQKGMFSASVLIPKNFLAEGTYIISVAIFNHEKHFIHLYEKDIIIFNILETYNGGTARGKTVGNFPGVTRPILNWEITLK